MVLFWGRCTTHFSLFSGYWAVHSGVRDFDPWAGDFSSKYVPRCAMFLLFLGRFLFGVSFGLDFPVSLSPLFPRAPRMTLGYNTSTLFEAVLAMWQEALCFTQVASEAASFPNRRREASRWPYAPSSGMGWVYSQLGERWRAQFPHGFGRQPRNRRAWCFGLSDWSNITPLNELPGRA